MCLNELLMMKAAIHVPVSDIGSFAFVRVRNRARRKKQNARKYNSLK